ncbi:MAG: hypothetical protein E7511_06220 [Ruminococcus sp.]|nr:hypothetical protein [Ruminococcus sp.]MBQ7003213.1 hypothetical protein [Oscillospiraceae bacterium]
MDEQNNFGTPVNPDNNYNPYGNDGTSNYQYGGAPQDAYNQNPMNGGFGGGNDPELEKRAGTVQTLGIVSVIIAVVIGFCCCIIPGPVVGIVGLVKANGLTPFMGNLSPEAQKKVKLGKILCFVAIGLGVAGLIFNIITNVIMGGNAFTEALTEAMNDM